MLSREELDIKLANQIAQDLDAQIASHGSSSLFVSGGSTPERMFVLLSQQDIDWSLITVSLVDDRLLPDEHQDQNGRMVRSKLLQNNASKATFIPLVYSPQDTKLNLQQTQQQFKNLKRPIGVTVLGMGTDGHTASLFPSAKGYDEAMRLDFDQDLVVLTPQDIPYSRISLTRKSILNSREIYLHIYGEEKKQVLDQAKSTDDYWEYPISGILQQRSDIHIYWAP